MTRVLVDGSHLRKRDQTGISSYARTLATGLHDLGADVLLLLGGPASRNLSGLALAGQVFGNAPPRGRIMRRLTLLRQTSLGFRRRLKAARLETEGIDLASLDPPLPPHQALFNAAEFFDRALAAYTLRGRFTSIDLMGEADVVHWTAPAPLFARRMTNIYTLHDLIPLKFPQFTIDQRGSAARVHAAIGRRADHVVTVSQASADDIRQLLGVGADRISVTYQPVVPVSPLPMEDAERLVTDIYGATPGKFVFFCGALEPKKNLARLIEAFIIAGTGMQLLLAGPRGWLFDDVTALLDLFAGSSRPPVRYLGYLPRRHMAALMQTACFFAFPSIYEGFGLPVAEAMSLGVPVLTSRGGALAEVAGTAAELVDPLDVGSIATSVRRLAADADLRTELGRRGPAQVLQFAPEAYRARLSDAYRRAGVRLDPV